MILKRTSISPLITYLLLFTVIVNVSLVPVLIPIPSTVFQILLYGSLVVIIIFFTKKVQINLRMLLVIVAAFISLILSDADAKYDTTNRFLTWLLVVSTIGPLFYSKFLIQFRNKLLETFIYIFMIIGFVSIIYFALGLPHLGRGHFTGIMSHSMILGPISAIGGLYAFYRFMKESRRKIKLLFFILFICNFMSVFLAASRTAFVGMMVGLFFYLTFNKFRFRKIIILILMIVSIGFVSSLETLQHTLKNSDTLLSRKVENTREGLWNDRINEFKKYPLFGVGFASQDDTLLDWKRKSKTGQIEPGSTYLMVLSMTGIVGAFTMIILLIKPLLSKNFWKVFIYDESYKGAIFLFFYVHFIAEGYIFASGSTLGFIFWLLLGATYPYNGIKYRKELSKS